MKQISSSVEINASADCVWQILTDSPRLSEWNTFLVRLEGTIQPGKKLKVSLKLPGGKPMTFRPKVLTAETNQELSWLGHFGFGGFFKGQHRFTIEPLDESTVRFTQEETFSGLFRPLLGSLLRKTGGAFEDMNRGLKARAEATERRAATAAKARQPA